MWEILGLYLKAEEPNGVDDVVLSGGTNGRQHCGHVVHPEAKEEQEAQQMAPDIHCLIGQNEEAAQRIYKVENDHSDSNSNTFMLHEHAESHVLIPKLHLV